MYVTQSHNMKRKKRKTIVQLLLVREVRLKWSNTAIRSRFNLVLLTAIDQRPAIFYVKGQIL